MTTRAHHHLRDAETLREPEIKAAIIDTLFENGMIDGDAVVITEMPVAAMSRRADLVIANGHLIGIEIKSDSDRTSRLGGQITAYQKAFEGTVIVTGLKHLAECTESAPASVGIVAIDRSPHGTPVAKMTRKPRLSKMDVDQAISQMRADELYRYSLECNVNPLKSRDRFTLTRILQGQPVQNVRNAALKAIKERYRMHFDEFNAERHVGVPTLEAMKHLQRPVLGPRARVQTRLTAADVQTETAELSRLSLSVRRRFASN